jgi:ribosomal-protein-alanine N-acetyltransferase
MTLPPLSTRQLDLRPTVAGELDALWALWRDPDVRRYLFDDIPVTRECAAEVLNQALAMGDGLGLWTVSVREASSVIGCVGLMRVTTAAEYDPRLAGAIEPVVAFAPAVWRRGYAREALGAAIAYAFTALKLPVLAAVTDTPNQASHRLLSHLGFEATGECEGPRYRMRTHALTRERFAAAGQAPAALYLDVALV